MAQHQVVAKDGKFEHRWIARNDEHRDQIIRQAHLNGYKTVKVTPLPVLLKRVVAA